MALGIGYWLLVWLMMAMAFTTAWTFIVKGCEAMDGPQEGDNQSHH